MTDGPRQRQAMPVLEVMGIAKTFAGNVAVHPLDLEVRAGEIRALVGENGSGKSTLVKILSGYHAPDQGEIRICGEPLHLARPGDAYQKGCRFVHQDLALVGTMSVLDNLCLTGGFLTRWGTLRSGECRARARRDLDRFGLDIDPDLPVNQLSPTAQACVAIARAMHVDDDAPARLLVLDEPTAALPDREADHLLDLLRRIADEGVAVLYISHRLSEVFRLAHTVTVLRDGHSVATEPAAELDHERLVALLVGSVREELSVSAPATVTAAETLPVLSVRDLTAEGLSEISIDVHPGEILGIAGFAGSGRETLLGALFGDLARDEGTVEVAGQALPPSRPDLAIGLGVAYLPAERNLLGAMMQLSARENLTLPRLGPFWHHLRMHQREETWEAAAWFDKLDVRPRSGIEAPLDTFSGGNQQKILLAKWLRLAPKLLLVDEPTQGVDVAARAAVHHYLREAACGGTTVIVSSSDTEELTSLCSRVLVFNGVRIAGELEGVGISQAGIARHAWSHLAGAAG